MPCRRSGIRVNSTLFLIPHLTSVFLSFSHVSSPFLHWNVWGVSPFAWQQFLVQAGLYHDPRFCITFPVGSSFDARWVAHIEWLPVSFDVAYNSASQSTFFCSVFFSVPIFFSISVGGVVDRLFYGSYQLYGYFTSMLGFFFLGLLAHFQRVSTFHIGYLSYVAPNTLRVYPLSISFFLYDRILHWVSPICPEVPIVRLDVPSCVAMTRLEEISWVCCLWPRWGGIDLTNTNMQCWRP